jgi:uncharacterized membrane protein
MGDRPGCDLLHLHTWNPAQPDSKTHHERDWMMNNSYGWMGGGASGGMWIWTVIGVLVVVLLVVLIKKVSTK